MKLRNQHGKTDGRKAGQPHDDSGGHGAEYVDCDDRTTTEEDALRDRTAWSRARHWTPPAPDQPARER